MAEGEFPEPVHAVYPASPVVSLSGPCGCGLGCGCVGAGRCSSVQGAVGSFVVVDMPELFQLFVQVRQGMGARLTRQPFLQGLVEAFDLALGLRVVRGAVFLGDAQGVELVCSKAFRPPRPPARRVV